MKRTRGSRGIWLGPNDLVAYAHFGFFTDGSITWYANGGSPVLQVVRIV